MYCAVKRYVPAGSCASIAGAANGSSGWGARIVFPLTRNWTCPFGTALLLSFRTVAVSVIVEFGVIGFAVELRLVVVTAGTTAGVIVDVLDLNAPSPRYRAVTDAPTSGVTTGPELAFPFASSDDWPTYPFPDWKVTVPVGKPANAEVTVAPSVIGVPYAA